MKRLNKKGMTVVELIISFAILMILVLGMLKLVMEVKDTLYEKQLAKDFTEYSSNLNKVLHDDFLKRKVISFSAEVNNEVCSNADVKCYEFTFEKASSNGENNPAVLIINMGTKTINYNSKVYEIPNKEEAMFLDTTIIQSGDIVNNDVEVKVSTDDNSSTTENLQFLIVNIPFYYRNDLKTNYGFKIVHPIGK